MKNQLRDYQIRLSKDATNILQRKKIVCLFMEVRTGKSLTALETCKLSNANNVLFITKIKAFSSIQSDYDNFGYSFKLTIINKESLHKIETNDFDVIIVDECHGYSSYPKPSKYAKDVKKRFGNIPMILLSGTPTPESYSQYYHLFWISNHSPFKEFTNFYKWADKYVNVTTKHLGYAKVNDYSDARKKDFWHLIRHNILTFTQKEAGFTTDVKELVLFCEMQPITQKIIDKLKRDLVVTSSDGRMILADTGVKLQQKVHQLSSGTVKFEDGTSKVIDYSKAEYIKNNFKGNKIAIFYKFKEEYNALKKVFDNELTNYLDEFNTTDKNIALQVVSGREGISLKAADALIFYNIDFSYVSYAQARDRLTTMDRKDNTVYWIFSKGGIEEKIYKTVINKGDYTNSLFKKDYDIRIKNSAENNKETNQRRLALYKTNKD